MQRRLQEQQEHNLLPSVTIGAIVTGMRTTCKNPDCPRKGKRFVAERAGAQYCSTRCRVAAHRRRQAPQPSVQWWGKVPGLAKTSRSLNADGTPALSNEELGQHLVEIAEREDDGKPKTGRRYY